MEVKEGDHETALIEQIAIIAIGWWRCREYPTPRYMTMSETETDLFRAVARLARLRGEDHPC